MSDNHVDILNSITPARVGWFAFFEDRTDEDCPLFGEPIEAWGTYDVYYPDDEDLNGREVHAMKVDEETGMLTGDFVDARNFLGVMFSKELAALGTDLILFEHIMGVPKLHHRLENIVTERNQAEEMHIPGHTIDGFCGAVEEEPN